MARKFHIYYHSKLPAGRGRFVRVKLGGLGHCWCRASVPAGETFDQGLDYPLEILGWYGFVKNVSELIEARILRHDPIILTMDGLSQEDRDAIAGLYVERDSGVLDAVS